MEKTGLMRTIRLWPLLLAVLLLLSTAAMAQALNWPDGLTHIETEAFYNDTSLSGPLNLPGSVIHIGDRAFDHCRGVTALTLPSGLQHIGSRAFADTGLTGTVVIPGTVTFLAEDAFAGTGVTIVHEGQETPPVTPDPGSQYEYRVNSRGVTLVRYTGTLTELQIPAQIEGQNVVEIGDGCFQYHDELTGSVIIPGTVTRIGSHAFEGCVNLDGSVTIPSSVTEIGDYAFFECLSLTGSLTIPESVGYIGDYAFSWCESMTGGLRLPFSAFIGERCFSWAGFQDTLHIPASLTLGPNVFANTRLTITWDAPGFTYRSNTDGTVALTGWNGPMDQGLTIPESITGMTVTGIDPSAFSSIGISGQITIPGTVKEISAYAFCYNDGVNGLTIGSGVTRIGEYAFAGCINLPGIIYLPQSCTDVALSAFDGCNVSIQYTGN